MTKKVIDVLRKYASLTYELSGTIDEVVKTLQDLKQNGTKEGCVLVLEWETEYGSYGDSDRQQVNLYDRRLETDEEYVARLVREKAEKDAALDRKRRQLEALKKELGES